MKSNLTRRDIFRWGGVLTGTALLEPWKMAQKWEADIQKWTESDNGQLARLCYNENPYGPSTYVKAHLSEKMKDSYIYPFAQIEALAEKLAIKHGVSRDHIVVTAGSREGLKVAALLYAGHKKEVISCIPTYKALLDYAVLHGGILRHVPLDDQMRFDLSAMEKQISPKSGLLFLCNPNNPTGTLLPEDMVQSFCESVSKRVMIFADEVYYDYIKEPDYPSMISLVKEGKDIIVARTFSKIYGLAGIRVGYLIARPDIAQELRQNLPAATSITGAWAGMAAMDDNEFYQESLKKNNEGLEMIYAACQKAGIEYLPSHTNFVFVHTGQPIAQFQQKMKDLGVLVGRPFPPYDDWCRISTGHLSDVAKCAKVLPQALQA